MNDAELTKQMAGWLRDIQALEDAIFVLERLGAYHLIAKIDEITAILRKDVSWARRELAWCNA